MSASFSQPHLELLKNQVLETAGFRNISPADCRVISSLISKKTRQCVSETTFKRLYGFAVSKFKPSLFTIDVLAKYCDYDGWKHFCDSQKNTGEQVADEDADWHNLQRCANKITAFTIQALKNRSGIPFNQTIKRAFVEEHFKRFNESDNLGTIFCSPTGYGKSISLCHWIEDKLEQNTAYCNDDIVLFFSTNALMSALLSGRNIHDWILALLGYSAEKDVNFLLDNSQPKKGKFYLVIDGFDEHFFKKEEFHVILNQLVDLFSFHQSNSWFKLVLTMRSSTWINNRHLLEGGNSSWYTGFKFNDDCINVPLFTFDELKLLCTQINPTIRNFDNIKNIEIFTYPIYFQFYYKQHKADFNLSNVDHVAIHELISIFILNKVHLGQHAAEKLQLLRGLVENMNFEEQKYKVNALKANKYIKQCPQAYQELLSIGYLKEINESNDYQYNTYIKFGNNHLLTQSIAKTLLYQNDDQFDSKLIKNLNTLFAESTLKLPVLKWCLIHAIKTGQQNSFGRLPEIDLNSNEKTSLIVFLGDLLNSEWPALKKNEAFALYFNQDFNKELFDYFFGLELINKDYKKTLQTLLKFELSDRKKILVNTTLGIIALINLDLNEMQTCLVKLKSFPKENYLCFAVNPLTCLDAIYNHFKYGIIKKEILKELTTLSFNPPEDDYNLKDCGSNDMLYLLGLYSSILFNNFKKTQRLIEFVKKNYKDDEKENGTSAYGFFIKILLAESNFKMGNADKVNELYYDISNSYKKSKNLLSPYMKTLFHCLKIKLLVNSPREELIITEMQELNSMANISGSTLSKLVTLAMILKKDKFLAAHPNVHRQYYYEYTKIVTEFKLNTEQTNTTNLVYR